MLCVKTCREDFYTYLGIPVHKAWEPGITRSFNRAYERNSPRFVPNPFPIVLTSDLSAAADYRYKIG